MHWVGPNEECPLLPKNQGLSLMISAFQSRELDWGVGITEEEWKS